MDERKVQNEFTLKDQTVENFRPIKVIVVGAGLCGILAAIRIPERMRNVELIVYEKSEKVGGVWWLSKYPGVACDVPSHSYQYSFAPNPNWSDLYAPGSEIQQYFEGVAKRFGAMRFIKTNHKVEHAEWNDSEKKWKVKIRNLVTDEEINDESDIFITARGQLSEPSWPDIPGFESFKGKVMHSGQWDDTYDFRNKKIGVIGNGSSAIQIIPQLQKVQGTTLTCFMRSPTWISPSFGDVAMEALGLDPTATAFTPEQKAAFTSDPEEYLRIRKVFEDDGNLIQDTTILSHPTQVAFQTLFRENMQKKLASRPDLASLLIPSFAPGCRRVTPGRGFLESLQEPNVTVVSSPISSITPTGITSASSDKYDFDVLICATGFRVASSPQFPILGRNALPLSTRWSEHPSTYLSVAVDQFPNLFFMFGPNSAIGFGSLTKILEGQADYIFKLVRKLQKEDYASMEPLPERVKDFEEYVDTYFRNTVYMDQCNSWYKSKDGKKVVGLWPGSTLHALEALRAPRWEDWKYEVVGGKEGRKKNALSWLGNGRSVTQDKGGGDPSWYLNVDEIEVPIDGRPEENQKYRNRPWGY
ncbi:hypothetical protein QBC38DRAFT_355715 [Podospora fimiseda]|uniref:Monooxygenase n=1 Tax=Podospora fimiseda TaxID=252190 RepID=A0AAN7H4M7_9PEZI|nr:hypothetical protein QBC38DRAFT_355715 [Podospora fimiseda]